MNTFTKKFPKPPADAGEHEPAEFDLDESSITRNSKVRGGIEVLHIKTEESFDPYQRLPEDRQKGSKRDLRKLSEHIKLMRKLDELKKDDGAEE